MPKIDWKVSIDDAELIQLRLNMVYLLDHEKYGSMAN